MLPLYLVLFHFNPLAHQLVHSYDHRLCGMISHTHTHVQLELPSLGGLTGMTMPPFATAGMGGVGAPGSPSKASTPGFGSFQSPVSGQVSMSCYSVHVRIKVVTVCVFLTVCDQVMFLSYIRHCSGLQ